MCNITCGSIANVQCHDLYYYGINSFNAKVALSISGILSALVSFYGGEITFEMGPVNTTIME